MSLFRTSLLLVLMAVAGLAGWAYFWHRSAAVDQNLQIARAFPGTRQSLQALIELASDQPKNAEAAFLLAQEQRMRKRVDEADQSLRRAEELGWPRGDIEQERVLLLSRSAFQQAEPMLLALLDRNPDDRDVSLALAMGWCSARSFKKAEAVVNALLERNPDDGFALCFRGRMRLLQQLPFQAKPDLERAMQQGPDQYYYSDARMILAYCLLEIGKFEDSLVLYRQCLEDEPKNLRVLFGIAKCNWYLGRWEESEDTFLTLLRLDPEHLDALSQLAYIYEEKGRREEALKLLEKAVKNDPTWADLHFRMAKILLVLGHKEQAAIHQKRAEEVKKHWVTPRPGTSTARNPYTGNETGSRQNQIDR